MRLAAITSILVFSSAVTCLRAAAPVSFNRDIRPILSDNCFACHGPDKSNRKARLRLDLRDEALRKEAFVPGKPDESELVQRIFTSNEDDVMPPSDSPKKLTAREKELLKRWIAEGAQYEPHWAFITPKRPPLPKVTDAQRRVRNPIDAFILQQLEAHRISPSPEADKRTLLRRVSLDLTGLPPTPDEMAAFLGDRSANAYEKQVERLLASPHFGERMAVPWLDVVRYADTVGYHGDQNVNVFPYRDYVIDSFNRNKPFDQFTIEQIAGDLLPNNTVEQRIATGFNRLNMVTREGGAQPKEYMAKYGADRARTVGMAWLGLTVGCAECHDHKFDPVTTRDFYSLKAFFADVRQWGVYNDYKYTPNPDLKGWSNEHPFPPEEVVDSPYLRRRLERVRGDIQALAGRAATDREENFKSWMRNTARQLEAAPEGWISPEPIVMAFTNTVVITNRAKVTNVVTATESAPARTNVTNRLSFRTNTTVTTNFTVEADGSLLFANRPDAHPIPLRVREGVIASLRLELLPHARHSNTVFRGNRASATLQLAATLRRGDAKKERKLAFHHADADHKEPRYANGSEVIGIRDSWKVSREHADQKQTGVWQFDPPLRVEDGDILTLTLKTNLIGAIRVSVSPLAAEDPLAVSAVVPSVKSATNPAAAMVAWMRSDVPDTNTFANYKRLYRDLLECRGGRTPTVVTVSRDPEVTRVLPRGNWQSDDGDVVEPLPPHFLPQPAREGANRLTRLDLANWLVSPENPLTGRTVVNRFWKQFFGSGLANPVDDLGLQGETPSHPELLDWLAVEFMKGSERAEGRGESRASQSTRPSPLAPQPSRPWDIKHIVRLIVTSATYRQSSNLRPELHDLDPNNRLLASQNPRRLDAEFVRDNALKIAGLLNEEMGGPSVYPYQPPGYYSNLQFPDRDYLASKDERQYRRGVYAHWQRTFLQPMLANFDAPSREECVGYRIVSNTPQQALTLLNDPTFVEAARVFAQKLLAAPATSDNARLELAYQQALGRPIKSKELESLKQFLAAQREHLGSDKEEAVKIQKVGLARIPEGMDAAELAAWTSVCRVVLNLHEVISVY